MNTAVKTPTNAVTAKAAVGKGDVSPKFCKTKNRHGCSYIIAHKRFYILSRLSVLKLGTQRISGMDLKPTKWRTAKKSLNWNHLPRIRPINSLLSLPPWVWHFQTVGKKYVNYVCEFIFFFFSGGGEVGGGILCPYNVLRSFHPLYILSSSTRVASLRSISFKGTKLVKAYFV